jgi:hypothetical protein
MNLSPQYIFTRLLRLVLFWLLLLSGAVVFAQTTEEEKPEEISVLLNIPRVGSNEVDAFVQGQNVFLSVKEVFDFLKVKNRLSADADTLSGFLIDNSTPFLISKDKNTIVFQKKHHALQPGDLIRTETGLYLRCNYFGVFGLECSFDFRSLAVTLTTKVELPLIREMQQELTRRNLSRLKGERKADTTFGQEFPLFRLGAADWGVNITRYLNGSKDIRMSLSLGGIIAGGEATANINHTAGRPFERRSQNLRWRLVNNNRSWLRQVSLGRVATDAASTLTAPLNGFQLNNTPTTYRRSFGTYILSNVTQPGWLVELYVNNILINYTRADASGFFTFEVPMVYGNSNVKLRFYGPWGEEQTKEQSVVIPVNFLPQRQFEYNITGGIMDDSTKQRFGRASVKYGLDNSVTIGAGVEYLSGVTPPQAMPYVNASMRLFSKVILFGEHMYRVRNKAVLSYRHPSNLQVDINYVTYDKNQTAVKFLEEKRAVLSMPFRSKKFSAFTRLTLSQFTDTKRKPGTSAELLLSAFFSRFSSNFTTYAILSEQRSPLIWSNLSLTLRLPGRLQLTQQTFYEYRKQRITMVQTDLEKNIFRNGFLNLSYARNTNAGTTSYGIGLRFNLSFAQMSAFAGTTNSRTSYVQNIRGSVLYDDNIGRLSATDQTAVGRAGISIIPFLDINGNGHRDDGEPKVCGLKLKVSGGKLTHCNSDTTIQITGLEPYNNYSLEIDKTSFDNIAWQVRNPLVNVVADPNRFKRVEVPVGVLGEASGKVLLQNGSETNGLGRIIVKFYRKGKLVAKVMTESDGYFNYIGFTPGNYTAEIDKSQLEMLNLSPTPGNIPFTIRAGREGDFVEGLTMVLKKKNG